MPIPSRKSGEELNKYISRCIAEISDEYETSQAAAICYSKSREKMEEATEVFVLRPKRSENRGSYLSRCTKNNKMRLQYPSLKERSNFCLTSFNEYYRYWAKSNEFGKIPRDTNLGACIAKERASGADYRTAYASCATRVVAPSGPIVLNEDNLIIEPVMFADISIDFDDTLSTKRGQELAKKLIDDGNIVHIITRRPLSASEEVYKIADELGIDREDIHFTDGELKWKTIKSLGILKHIDNNPDELKAIKENLPEVQPVKFEY